MANLLPSTSISKDLLRKKAFDLRADLRARKQEAIQRARKVFHDLINVNDESLAKCMGISRCEHVIAIEQTGERWNNIKENKLSTPDIIHGIRALGCDSNTPPHLVLVSPSITLQEAE